MKKFFIVLFLTAFSCASLADATTEKIKKADPEAFADAEADCKQWAEDDQAEDVKTYVDDCINDMLGYLVEENTEDS